MISNVQVPLSVRAVEVTRNTVEVPNDGMYRGYEYVEGRRAFTATVYADGVIGGGDGRSAAEAIGAALLSALQRSERNSPEPIRWVAA